MVLDVSAEDAVYEDESRELCLEAVDTFTAKGFTARRVDESELPKSGCRAGPCLEKVARGNDVLVTVDVVELEKSRLGVAVTALAGRTGMPLAGGRGRSARSRSGLRKSSRSSRRRSSRP